MTTIQQGPLLPRHQVALFRELASRMMGKEYVDRLWSELEPVIRNRIGHGEPLEPNIVGDADDPKNNYWKGVWQVYHAE
jgi:hypothetical protein